jgi:uncharacterized protein
LHFQALESYPLPEEDRMPPISREDIKRLIIETLRPIGVTRIALFGSFARNEASPGSDIDILVTFPKSGKRKPIGLKWFSLDQELSRKIGMPVDLVSENALPRALRPIIERDLEVIYEEAG